MGFFPKTSINPLQNLTLFFFFHYKLTFKAKNAPCIEDMEQLLVPSPPQPQQPIGSLLEIVVQSKCLVQLYPLWEFFRNF